MLSGIRFFFFFWVIKGLLFEKLLDAPRVQSLFHLLLDYVYAVTDHRNVYTRRRYFSRYLYSLLIIPQI